MVFGSNEDIFFCSYADITNKWECLFLLRIRVAVVETSRKQGLFLPAGREFGRKNETIILKENSKRMRLGDRKILTVLILYFLEFMV